MTANDKPRVFRGTVICTRVSRKSFVAVADSEEEARAMILQEADFHDFDDPSEDPFMKTTLSVDGPLGLEEKFVAKL